MQRFQSLFFSSYIAPDEEIKHVFHRHVFVIIEDIVLWMLFGLLIPGAIYSLNVFHIQDALQLWHVYVYIFLIYFILIYKVFDWYTDVWILTDKTLIDLRWKWFTSNVVLIPFEKIEGIEVRTFSWIYSVLGISDVVAKLVGSEALVFRNARDPQDIVHALQEAVKPHHAHAGDGDDREPFDILVDTLSDVVKGHLVAGGKSYITKDYVDILDTTLTHGRPIDLRTQDEKVIIQEWKGKYKKKKESDQDDGHH